MECAANLAEFTEAPSAAPSVATSNGFVGRQREMEQLTEALEDARTGRGRLVMLVGEPGIGKTRTAQELVAQAESSGCISLWGRCYEEGGTPPYWPWLQVLNACFTRRSPDQLKSEMGPGAFEIAEIIPELREILPGLGPSLSSEPEQARFRLFSSISTFLKNVALSQPLLVVLDDMHWADRSSLLLLEFLAREIPSGRLMILGTYRDVEMTRRHPLSETLGSLLRERGFLRLQLLGLAQPEVELLLRYSVESSPAPDLLTALHQRTEGNPLFVGEIARMLAREGASESWNLLISIPEGIRDALSRRLNRLSEDCSHTLTIAAVIGREFNLDQIKRLAEGLTAARLLEVLEEALAARVIEEIPEAVGRYQFAHTLIQETLIEDLTLTRRVQLHATIAESLEELYGSDSESHAAELAYHFAQAETLLGTEKLVRYLLLAGEYALSTFAYEEAQHHFERGLEARKISLACEDFLLDAVGAALIFGYGRSRVGTADRGQMEEVAICLARAFDYYVESGDPTDAISVAEYPVPFASRRTALTRTIRKALTLVDPDSLEQGRLLARYGFELGRVQGDDAAAEEPFKQALAIARDAGDIGLQLKTLTSSAEVDLFQLRLEESIAKSLEGIGLAARASDSYSEASARLSATRALMLQGEGARAQAQALAFLALAERLRDRHLQVTALELNSSLSLLGGDWPKARNLAEEALELAPQDPNILVILAMIGYETGNFSRGETYLERLLELMAQTPPSPRSAYFWPAMAIPYAARISGTRTWLDEAAAAAGIVNSSPAATPMLTVIARCGLGLKSIIESDAAAAAEQYAALELVQGIMVPFYMAGDRILGLLSQAMGNRDQGMAHFEDGLAFCQKAGFRPELAWSYHDYADTLLQRNGPGDQARATSLLAEALTTTQELGMAPLLEKVLALQDRAQSRPGRAPAYPDNLSQREVEVLRLIAGGKTDREIARELIISARTVGNHVSSILNKTGAINRTEAASYATRYGLD